MSNPKYRRLSGSLDDEEKELEPVAGDKGGLSRRNTYFLGAAVAVLMVVTTLLGFLAGRCFTNPSGYKIDHWNFQYVTRSFQYNRTFSESPSPETDAAWMSIFPPHGGFFHDKTIASDGASLAVYHQLHCLDAIRHAYWILHDAVKEQKNLSMDGLADWYTPWHTRHCIDFLRQMLMCNADTTIERNDPKIGGIRGFGINHQCKNWDDVSQWTLARQQAGIEQGYVYSSDQDFGHL